MRIWGIAIEVAKKDLLRFAWKVGQKQHLTLAFACPVRLRSTCFYLNTRFRKEVAIQGLARMHCDGLLVIGGLPRVQGLRSGPLRYKNAVFCAPRFQE